MTVIKDFILFFEHPHIYQKNIKLDNIIEIQYIKIWETTYWISKIDGKKIVSKSHFSRNRFHMARKRYPRWVRCSTLIFYLPLLFGEWCFHKLILENTYLKNLNFSRFSDFSFLSLKFSLDFFCLFIYMNSYVDWIHKLQSWKWVPQLKYAIQVLLAPIWESNASIYLFDKKISFFNDLNNTHFIPNINNIY